MFVAAGPSAEAFAAWIRRLGGHCTELGERAAPDHRLIHMDARSVLTASDSPRLRLVLERSRRHGALVSLELGAADWIRARGGDRTAYQLAAVQPDVLFASEEAAAELAAPLEGIAAIPVLLGAGRLVVHGRGVAVPAGAELDPQALAAAFCYALVDGAAPVEAAARAVLIAIPSAAGSGEGAGGGQKARL